MPARRRSQRSDLIWPGFVDALSTLLLAIIFLLVVFMLAQFFLNQALTGRDEALTRLNREVAELAELLALERQSGTELRLNVAQLSASLQESTRQRDELTDRIDETTMALSAMTTRAESAEATLAEAERTIIADRETVELQLKELASLRADIDSLRIVRRELESEVGRLAAALDQSDSALTAVRDRTKALEAELATEQERTLLAQETIEERDIRLAELGRIAEEAKQQVVDQSFMTARAENQVVLLNQQIAALREQLTRIEAALLASEAKDAEQKTVIADLGKRLNVALARRVEELSKYRSEFFGRLREVLGDRRDIMIVGDRFVFQSEVLFESGSAELGAEGRVQLAKLADTLIDISADIPADIPWILRIDGHTDRIPIATAQFPSNWELSTSRAISVARFLVGRGLPADRVAATGFAEYQPLDPRDDEIAYRRNRRIELKLTER